MMRHVAIALTAIALVASPVRAAQPPATWDGLAHQPSKALDAVYLLPGADFRPYAKVMLDPTEVAFRKDWLRDLNSTSLDLSTRVSDAEARKILDRTRTGFERIFQEAYEAAGYRVVTEPGPDVLRVRTAVADLYVSAPDRAASGRVREFAPKAGSATVILEARDSLSGALLGRAVDARTAGDAGPYLRNSVTNRADFRELFKRWAKISADGLAELKALSPLAGAGPAAPR